MATASHPLAVPCTPVPSLPDVLEYSLLKRELSYVQMKMYPLLPQRETTPKCFSVTASSSKPTLLIECLLLLFGCIFHGLSVYGNW